MTIFFVIGAFQLTCSVAGSVKNQWANFVGTKIGSLHALYVLSQFISLPAWAIFQCAEKEIYRCTVPFGVSAFILGTATGMGHGGDMTAVTWFLSVFYVFIMAFPFVDDYLREFTFRRHLQMVVVFGLIATFILGILYMTMDNWVLFYYLCFTIVTWWPCLVTAMLMGYIYRQVMSHTIHQAEEAGKIENQDGKDLRAEQFLELTKKWGYLADAMSVLLLITSVVVATSPSCLCLTPTTFESMRPGEELPETCSFSTNVLTCDITHSEYVEYVRTNEDEEDRMGRFFTEVAGALGYLRLGSPIVLVWLFALSFGNGFTARMLRSKIMTNLAPLSYPIYLFHTATASYYWMATRGYHPEWWWYEMPTLPLPVEWYEYFIILGLSMLLGYFVNTFLVPPLMPYTIWVGVGVCNGISSCMKSCCKADVNEEDDDSWRFVEKSGYEQILEMVKGLTGREVSRTTELKQLGLDSLGATALLGMLRASVPAAKELTLQQLSNCVNIGDLSDVLDCQILEDVERDEKHTYENDVSAILQREDTFSESD